MKKVKLQVQTNVWRTAMHKIGKMQQNPKPILVGLVRYNIWEQLDDKISIETSEYFNISDYKNP